MLSNSVIDFVGRVVAGGSGVNCNGRRVGICSFS